MLSTGEEVLLGDIVDTNASWLSSRLFESGFMMTTRMTVGDSLDAIADALSQLARTHDLVIVNGGLGPTSDDVTAEAAADASSTKLEIYPEWVERLQQMFDAWGREMPQSNIKQAMLPEGSTILDNPRGTACGFRLTISGAECYFTPGVPHEFKTMVNEEIIPHIQDQHIGVKAKQIHRLFTYGLSESGIANMLEPLPRPKGVSLGYRSALPYIEVKLFYSEVTAELSRYLDAVEALLKENTVSINCQPVEAVFKHVMDRKLVILDGVTQGYLHAWLAESNQGKANIHSLNQDLLAEDDRVFNNTIVEGADYCLVLEQSAEKQWRLSLRTQNNISHQIVEFKRDYSFRARSIVISAIALDMLRRDLEGVTLWGDYGSVVRLSSGTERQ